MLTQVHWPTFASYFSLFATWYHSVIKVDSYLSTVGNDGSACSVSENTILSERGDASATVSSNVPTLDSGSCSDQNITWSYVLVSVYNDSSIEYMRMSLKGGTDEGLVAVSDCKISVEL